MLSDEILIIIIIKTSTKLIFVLTHQAKIGKSNVDNLSKKNHFYSSHQRFNNKYQYKLNSKNKIPLQIHPVYIGIWQILSYKPAFVLPSSKRAIFSGHQLVGNTMDFQK